MGQYLRVDLAELADAEKSLDHLCKAFDACEDLAGAVARDVGSDDIAGALDTFASNWKFHRLKLLDQLRGLRDMADHAHTTYIGVDEELARQMVDARNRPVAP